MDFITCWASLGLWCVLYYLLSSGFTICIYNWWWCMLWPLAVTKQWPVGSLSPVAGPLVTLVPPRDTWHVTPHRTGSGNTLVNLVNRIVWVVGYLAAWTPRLPMTVVCFVGSDQPRLGSVSIKSVRCPSWVLAPPGPAWPRSPQKGWCGWVVGGGWPLVSGMPDLAAPPLHPSLPGNTLAASCNNYTVQLHTAAMSR